LIEYINRLLGALLGVFAIIQVALLLGKKRSQPTAWRLALSFLLVVVLTGLFGAVVVKYNLAHLSISVHLLFAIILIQIQLALVYAVQAKLFLMTIDVRVQRAVLACLLLIFIQSAIGTGVRMYVDDVSKALQYEQRENWLANEPVAFLIHRSFSWIVLLSTLLLAWFGRTSEWKRKLYQLAAIVVMSMIAGIVLYYADMPAIAQPIHLLLATVAITQCISILLLAGKKAVA
jgi:heme a synthase